ncbi:hypothetical protein [Butyrivibrio sp. AC2005]|uniref:hypothetical protein n=1 Tax=Butyrivibrio sp. AC2005 TaxID=1280672 RepID=UPI0003F920F4|nr:hypothetical protein [Butyrivibrio sp. AC2005]
MSKKKILEIIICTCCLIVIFMNAFHHMGKKKGLFLDEALTFNFSNNTVFTMGQFFSDLKEMTLSEIGSNALSKYDNKNVWLSHDEIEATYTAKDNKFNYFNTYLIQLGDVHPPLYYMVVHTISSLFPGMHFYYVGFITNLFFLMGTCVLIYRLCMLIFGNNICAIACTLFYGLSFDFINSVTFFRMYAMLTFWGILLVYLNVIWADAGFDYASHITKLICIVELAAMLTQYFAVFIILPIFVLNIILIKKIGNSIKPYVKGQFITGFLYFLVWPISIMHILFTNRGGDVATGIYKNTFLGRVFAYRYYLVNSIFGGAKKIAAAVVILLIVAICLKCYQMFKEKKRIANHRDGDKNYAITYILIVGIFYYIVACKLSPWVVDRYVMPAIPMICIIIIYFLEYLFSRIIRNKNISGLVLICISLILFGRWCIRQNPYYLYNQPDRIDYKNTYESYDALIIDDDRQYYYAEIMGSFEHPNIYNTEFSNKEEVLKILEKEQNCVVYISKYITNDAITYFDNHDCKLNKVDYSTDAYDIFISAN